MSGGGGVRDMEHGTELFAYLASDLRCGLKDIRQYLAEIGARGGRKSRRRLDPDTALVLVRHPSRRVQPRGIRKPVIPSGCDWLASTCYLPSGLELVPPPYRG